MRLSRQYWYILEENEHSFVASSNIWGFKSYGHFHDPGLTICNGSDFGRLTKYRIFSDYFTADGMYFRTVATAP
jgi:hypothetical protein